MKILNASFLRYLLVTAALFTSPLQIRAANSTTASGQSGDSSWPRERFGGGGFGSGDRFGGGGRFSGFGGGGGFRGRR